MYESEIAHIKNTCRDFIPPKDWSVRGDKLASKLMSFEEAKAKLDKIRSPGVEESENYPAYKMEQSLSSGKFYIQAYLPGIINKSRAKMVDAPQNNNNNVLNKVLNPAQKAEPKKPAEGPALAEKLKLQMPLVKPAGNKAVDDEIRGMLEAAKAAQAAAHAAAQQKALQNANAQKPADNKPAIKDKPVQAAPAAALVPGKQGALPLVLDLAAVEKLFAVNPAPMMQPQVQAQVQVPAQVEVQAGAQLGAGVQLVGDKDAAKAEPLNVPSAEPKKADEKPQKPLTALERMMLKQKQNPNPKPAIPNADVNVDRNVDRKEIQAVAAIPAIQAAIPANKPIVPKPAALFVAPAVQEEIVDPDFLAILEEADAVEKAREAEIAAAAAAAALAAELQAKPKLEPVNQEAVAAVKAAAVERDAEAEVLAAVEVAAAAEALEVAEAEDAAEAVRAVKDFLKKNVPVQDKKGDKDIEAAKPKEAEKPKEDEKAKEVQKAKEEEQPERNPRMRRRRFLHRAPEKRPEKPEFLPAFNNQNNQKVEAKNDQKLKLETENLAKGVIKLLLGEVEKKFDVPGCEKALTALILMQANLSSASKEDRQALLLFGQECDKRKGNKINFSDSILSLFDIIDVIYPNLVVARAAI